VRGGGARAVTDVFLAYGAPLGVTGPATRPALFFAESERAAARDCLARAGVVPGTTAIGVHPGGKWSVKRWPAEKFAELVTALRRRTDTRVVLFTGPGEEEATARVAALAGDAAAVLPAMGVREAAAVIAELGAMVACDGGIMHVAVAAGTPTVGIFGSAEPAVWFPYESFGPYRSASIPLDCRPCHRHACPLGHTRCLNDLSAGHVCARVEEVIAPGRGGR
jgi:ADP-heptose:LPS heptosyltransferase